MQEMHGADDIVKGSSREDVAHLVLLLEIADLNACLDPMPMRTQLFHEGKIIIEAILEFIFLEPLLLKLSDEGIIQQQGTPAELAERPGTFARLKRLQSLERELMGTP